jgi:hypothetical protein
MGTAATQIATPVMLGITITASLVRTQVNSRMVSAATPPASHAQVVKKPIVSPAIPHPTSTLSVLSTNVSPLAHPHTHTSTTPYQLILTQIQVPQCATPPVHRPSIRIKQVSSASHHARIVNLQFSTQSPVTRPVFLNVPTPKSKMKPPRLVKSVHLPIS